MTNRASKLILAAVLAASIPAAASADGRGCEHGAAPPGAWPPAASAMAIVPSPARQAAGGARRASGMT